MTQHNLHDIHLSLTKASALNFSAEAFVSERWISCKLCCVIELFAWFSAAWPKICKKSVFAILLYLLLPYGGTISTIFSKYFYKIMRFSCSNDIAVPSSTKFIINRTIPGPIILECTTSTFFTLRVDKGFIYP